MFWLKRLTIIQMTLLATGLLGVFCAALTVSVLVGDVEKLEHANTEQRLVLLVDAVEKIAHQHAVERGLTAGFLGSKSDVAKAKVIEQRQVVDNAVATLQQLANEDWPAELEIKRKLNGLFTVLKDKSAVRREVDSLNGKRAFGYYSFVNKVALDSANQLLLGVSNRDVSATISNALKLAWLKERLGQLRGKVNGVLAQRAINSQILLELEIYNENIEYLSSSLEDALDDNSLAEFKRLNQSTVMQSMREVYQQLQRENVDFSQLPAASEWFSTATTQIGQVKSLLDETWRNAQALSQRHADATRFQLLLIGVVALVALFIAAFIIVTLLQTLRSQLSRLTRNLHNVAREGDLTIDVSLPSDNELGSIAAAMNQTLQAIRDLITGLAQSVQASTRLGDQVAHSAKTINEESENTQQRAVSIAAAIEQMTETSKEIARSAIETLEASRHLDLLADEAMHANQSIQVSISALTQQMAAMESVAKNMGEQLTEISSILDTINSLSDQTNLLALNAAIEAARAGEHGRGFAVVADEVRQLANASRSSSDKISSLLDSLQQVSLNVIQGISKSADGARASLTLTNQGEETAAKVKASATQLETQANSMSAAAEEQSMTSEQIAADVVSVQDAATEEVRVAEILNKVTSDLQANNAILTKTMGNFRYE
ncbi:methyl-accepting chemotaxis protein [Alteromonas sp. AMM-1]|uniref:methyl-accepting chemotaxis protein n=1 Tax=Alteromonas sp. AMM-1 TaxID=3394233 RepID=UPI0039A6D4B6